MTTTADPEARRPGRPRSTEADEAILEAAVDLFAEGGSTGSPWKASPRAANVGKATIYRRYPCKVDLVIAASRCFALDDDDLPPDTGDTRADLRALVDWLIAMVTDHADRPRAPDDGRRPRADPGARRSAPRARRREAGPSPASCCSAASTAAISAPTSTSKS